MVQDQNGKRMLQEENKEGGFISTANFNQEGIVAQVFPDQSTKVLVNMDQLLEHLIKTDP